MATLSISLPAQFVAKIDTEAKSQGATRSELFRAILRKYFSNHVKFKPFVKIPLNDIDSELRKSGKYNDKFIKSVVKGFSRSSLYAG